MELYDALRTTGAVRRFSPDPVPDEVLYRVLDTARFAPNGGNRQAWHTVVIADSDIRRQLRDLYLPGWYEYLAISAAGMTPWAPVTNRRAEAEAAANAPLMAAAGAANPGFAEALDQAPVVLAVLADLRALAAVDRDTPGYTMIGGASVYPFVWNLLLAARNEGLGGTITTMAVRRQGDVLRLLHAPPELVLAAVVVLGWPDQPTPRALRRRPVEAFTTVDRCDGPAFTPGDHSAQRSPAGPSPAAPAPT